MASRSALPVAIACGVIGLLSLVTLGIQAGQISGTTTTQTGSRSGGNCVSSIPSWGTIRECDHLSPVTDTRADETDSWGTSQDKAVLAFAVLSLIWTPLSIFLYLRARASARFASHVLLQAGISGVLGLALFASAIAKAADDQKQHSKGASALERAGAAFAFLLSFGRLGLAALFVLLALRARSAAVAGSGVEQGHGNKDKQAMTQGPGVPVLVYQPPTHPAYPAYQPVSPAPYSPAASVTPLPSPSPSPAPPPPSPPRAPVAQRVPVPVPVQAPRRPTLDHGDSARKHSSSGRPSSSASYQTYPQHINYEGARPAGRDRSRTASDQQINIDVARAYDKEMARLDRMLRKSGAAAV